MSQFASNSRAGLLVKEWCARFHKDALASRVVTDLRGQSDRIWQSTFQLLQRESPEYRNSVDEEFTKESRSHCNELLKTIVAIGSGRVPKGGADPFDFVRGHAGWRARHQVPLIASLHAYRLAHRTYWGITRDVLMPMGGEGAAALAMLSDFWIELFDHVGAVLAEAHAVEERLMAGESSRTYAALMEGLLRGAPPAGAEAQRLCSLSGIRAGGRMVVAVARPLEAMNGKPIDVEANLRSLVRVMDQILPRAIGRLIDIRDTAIVAIACGEGEVARALLQAVRRSGLTRRAANGAAARVGVSRETVAIPGLPQAWEEAELAAQLATPSRPVLHFSDIDLPEFLIRHAAPAAFRLIPQWAREFSASGNGQARQLMRTIRAFADCSFNVKQTARHLGVHTNTVYFRLNRIQQLTGVDPRTYSGTARLLTALRLFEMQASHDVRR